LSPLPSYFWERRSEILALSAEHLVLVAVSTIVAAAVGIPAGIYLTRKPRFSRPILGIAGVVQTIPSLALFGFLIPLPLVGGIGAKTAIVALIVYALLPILRNTYAGIRSVDPAVVEAATGIGMTARQRLWWVELPLALPVVLAGVRIATVVSIGLATIAAAIGAGGLGVLIYRGIATVDNRLILAGAIPAALLAIAADVLFGRVERRFSGADQGARP
jgi:osmoprotectant transport system permease protein